MNDSKTVIPCPQCGTNIPFDPLSLIQGVKFTCPNCAAQIEIANESRDQVKQSMDELMERVEKAQKTQKE